MSKRIPEQMPGLLRRLDDPWGINWRIINTIKRFSLQRSINLMLAFFRYINYQRPVFICAAPRSGTTMLFDLLRTSNELGSLEREGHDLWRTFHHPRYSGWKSDNISAGQVRLGEQRYARAYLHAHGIHSERFIEKTPETSLRLPYILDLFPDAQFIIIKRNPADVINSIINGWRHPDGKYRSYFVPRDLSIEGYNFKRQWCFSLVNGWEELGLTSIPKIALSQWKQMNSAIVDFRCLIPQNQWLEIHFEHLLETPTQTLNTLCKFINIKQTPVLKNQLKTLIDHPVNALSAPGIGKWRKQNKAEIEPLIVDMIELSEKLGYQFEQNDFHCTQ